MEMTLVGLETGDMSVPIYRRIACQTPGSHVGRHISTLGLNDGEGSQRSTSVGVVHLGSTFEETGVKVEDVTCGGRTGQIRVDWARRKR